MPIDLNRLDQSVRDIIELREQTDQTFHRFCDNDYSDWFWNMLSERSNPNTEHSVIISTIGLQGCHSAGTKITTKSGLKNIEDIVAGDLVWSGNAWRMCIPIIRGAMQTMKVCLRNGIELNMTSDHVMFTKRGEVAAKDLVVGDQLISGNVPWSSIWNEESERAAVVAMLLADGHLDAFNKKDAYKYIRKSNRVMKNKPKLLRAQLCKRIRFYKSDDSLRAKFKEWMMKHHAAKVVGEYCDRGTKSTKVVCIQNQCVFDSVVADGVPIGKKSNIVKIPDWILKSDAAMNGFLAAYFACDGSFYVPRKGRKGSIEISSCSKELIDQLQTWLISKGCVVSCLVSRRTANSQDLYRLFIRQYDSLKMWADHVPNISDIKVMKLHVGAIRPGFNSTKEYLLSVKSIKEGSFEEVYDLHVKDVHEYLANGLKSSNSGKSLSMLTLCCFMDPTFDVNRIYFNHDRLVYDRQSLKPNTAVLVDEQSQSYGLDSHRIMIVLSNLKEQLRKKSIHFFFCSPVLYEEAKSSMYIIETIFIDFEAQEVYAALKTREGLTLGHIRIPHPLKVLEDGKSIVSPELLDAYQKKKDEHLETVLGNRDVDVFEERAKFIMKNPLFIKAEKIYLAKLGYVPQHMLIQLINKLAPEYRAGVVPLEIAGRIRLDRELSGKWIVAGGSKGGLKKTAKKRSK
jgi:intein/homing endonuclease